jgi:hypothetical protein
MLLTGSKSLDGSMSPRRVLHFGQTRSMACRGHVQSGQPGGIIGQVSASGVARVRGPVKSAAGRAERAEVAGKVGGGGGEDGGGGLEGGGVVGVVGCRWGGFLWGEIRN